jgi:hypothetical protein
MDNPHKRVTTTEPLAIKGGQFPMRVRNEGGWNRKTELVKCPNYATSFIVTAYYPSQQLLAALAKDHPNKLEHPDYIASAPQFTRVEDCDL